jgi:hypothetical protein
MMYGGLLLRQLRAGTFGATGLVVAGIVRPECEGKTSAADVERALEGRLVERAAGARGRHRQAAGAGDTEASRGARRTASATLAYQPRHDARGIVQLERSRSRPRACRSRRAGPARRATRDGCRRARASSATSRSAVSLVWPAPGRSSGVGVQTVSVRRRGATGALLETRPRRIDAEPATSTPPMRTPDARRSRGLVVRCRRPRPRRPRRRPAGRRRRTPSAGGVPVRALWGGAAVADRRAHAIRGHTGRRRGTCGPHGPSGAPLVEMTRPGEVARRPARMIGSVVTDPEGGCQQSQHRSPAAPASPPRPWPSPPSRRPPDRPRPAGVRMRRWATPSRSVDGRRQLRTPTAASIGARRHRRGRGRGPRARRAGSRSDLSRPRALAR